MATETARALEGIRVIDFGQYLAGPMVGMMLADYGAEVIRVDPPGGPRWQSDANAILHRAKRSIVLDLKSEADLETAKALIASADVVIENFRPGVMDRLGLSASELTATHPSLIWCSLPGFGSDDPRRDLQAFEGVICSAAGLYNPAMFVTTGAPVFNPHPLASFFGAVVASHGVAAALFHRERTGLGQRIEVPLYDACFQAIGCVGENPFSADTVKVRAMVAELMHPSMMRRYRCKDGKLVLMSPPIRPWLKLQSILLPEELIAQRDPDSVEKAAAILTEKWAARTSLEWEQWLQNEIGVCAATVQSTKDWLDDDQHARDTRCVVSLKDPLLGDTNQLGFGVLLDKTPPLARAPRRALDQDGAALREELKQTERPRAKAPAASTIGAALEGIRVTDISLLLAGPTATRVLANYGADVIKISNPLSLSPDVDPLSDHASALMGHYTVNDGKKAMLVNLKSPEGLDIARRLLATSDVVHQNFTPGVMDRLGLGEADVRQIKPDIIYSSLNLNTYGGFRDRYRGHEEIGQMITGVMDRLGGDGDPLRSPVLVNDHATGHLAAFGIIVALYHRLRGGPGQHVHTALSQTSTVVQLPYMISYEGKVWNAEPRGIEAKGFGALDRLYGSREGHFYLAVHGKDGLKRLASVKDLNGVDALAGDDLAKELELRFQKEPAGTWVGRIVMAGLSAHLYRPIHELMEDPLAKQRKLSVVTDHPGFGPIRTVGIPGKMSRTQPRIARPVPAPGLDTALVLEELGMGAEVDGLVERGAVTLG
jgi:crotonobetainyl-CoA:carnitine CoA-transferase CaiB-like acyl-CoA transferase